MNQNIYYNIFYYITLVFSVLLLLYTIGSISKFLGITFSFYGVYMIFGIAIAALYLILPSKRANIFA
jgi:hypothetical protein